MGKDTQYKVLDSEYDEKRISMGVRTEESVDQISKFDFLLSKNNCKHGMNSMVLDLDC